MRLTKTILLAGVLALPGLGLAGPPGLAPGSDRPGPAAQADRLPPHVLQEIREREDEILAWLETHDPDSHQRLLKLRERDPVAYMGHLARASRMKERIAQDPALVERHRRMRRLERQIETLSADYDTLDAKAQKARRAEVVALVAQLFELRQIERRDKLAELESKIEELRGEIQEREGHRAEIIEDYVDQLIRGPVDL